jgi:membrane protein DedA with SNARE-associated domain/rhodanese-related sulfurtransferase
MTETTQFIIRHGLPLIFVAVLVEQMGLPLPAMPWLLAAGALSAIGKFNLALGLLVAVVACLLADVTWFYLGRYRGNQILSLLCRISLEPDSCVRRTQNVFTKYGLRGLLVAKFVPGMSTVAPPLAGMSKVSVGRFLLFDGVGSLLYGGCILGLGFCFNRQIDQIIAAIGRIGGSALSLLIGLVVVFIAYKYWQRRRLLHELRMARITVAELRELLDTGKAPVIFDLRSSVAVEEDPAMIQGAVHLSVEEIENRLDELPRDRDIVVYCSCPNEVSSARLALRLHRKGFTRVRPLLGGIDAWREQNYPLQERAPLLAEAARNELSNPALAERAILKTAILDRAKGRSDSDITSSSTPHSSTAPNEIMPKK